MLKEDPRPLNAVLILSNEGKMGLPRTVGFKDDVPFAIN